jgi:hypothetical protein
MTEGHAICCVCATRNASVRRCSGCSVAYYCGSICQRKDWSMHKKECREPLAYNASEYCTRIMTRMVKSRAVRDQFAAYVRSDKAIHGITIRIANGHEARIALTTGNMRMATNFLTLREQYMDTPPISFTGKRPNLDYVIHLEVKQPGTANHYASLAYAVPLDFDEANQSMWIAPE